MAILGGCPFARSALQTGYWSIEDTRMAFVSIALSALHGNLVPNVFTAKGDRLFRQAHRGARIRRTVEGSVRSGMSTQHTERRKLQTRE